MDGKALFEQFTKLSKEQRRAFLETLKASPFCENCGEDNTGATLPCHCDPWWDEY